jgi:hypothetical protein
MEYIGRQEHNEFAKRMEEEHTRQNKRIGALEKAFEQQNKLVLSVERMSINMESMLKEQKIMGEELKELKEVPIKNWNTVKSSILSAIGGALGMGIIALIVFGIYLSKM